MNLLFKIYSFFRNDYVSTFDKIINYSIFQIERLNATLDKLRLKIVANAKTTTIQTFSKLIW